PSCPCGVRFAKAGKVVVLRPSSRGSHSTVESLCPHNERSIGFSTVTKRRLVWCTVKLDTDLGIVTQRRCPDASTRIIHRAPRARSSESDWRGEHQWLAETPAVFCTAEDRGRPPAVTWGTA